MCYVDSVNNTILGDTDKQMLTIIENVNIYDNGSTLLL